MLSHIELWCAVLMDCVVWEVFVCLHCSVNPLGQGLNLIPPCKPGSQSRDWQTEGAEINAYCVGDWLAKWALGSDHWGPCALAHHLVVVF